MNILLVRLRLVGDVIFTTPCIRAIRDAIPSARLSYLVEPYAAPIVQANPHLDEVIVAPRTRGLRRIADDLRIARELRARRFEAVVDFHGGPRGGWFTRATGAPLRIGYTVTGRTWVYTHPVPRTRQLRPRHSVENQWDLLAPLHPALARAADPARDPTEMPEDPVAARTVATRLAALGLTDAHELIVIHVSAGNPFRRWPAAHFAELAARMASHGPDRRIILTSGPSEADAAAAIAAGARARLAPAARDRIGALHEFNLTELRALIARSALFIGGDSGPLHLASTTRTPVVGLYGPTLAERSAPWRDPAIPTESVDVGALPCRPCDQRVCAPGDFRCLVGLGPELVALAAERALGAAARLQPQDQS